MKTNLKRIARGAVCVVGISVVACAVVHRRVIAAAVKGEPLPQPPEWHTWHRCCAR